MHPEQRDEYARDLAAHFTRANACSHDACGRRARVVARITMPDTLARIDVPLCHTHADEIHHDHAHQAVVTGDPVVLLVHTEPA